MPKHQPLEILPYDGPFDALVCSERDPDRIQYLVRLQENTGLGQCGCRDFETRKLPAANALQKKPHWNWPDQYRCKHLILLRRALAPVTLDRVLRASAMAKRKLETKYENRNDRRDVRV